MDFIVSLHLYNKIKEKERLIIRENIELIKKNNNVSIPKHTCPRCGQDRYLCQCENNLKIRYKEFNPEKDIY
tara:strand:+ start:847 stop:1062 length:216 start_codon:yes stop_codon:yes gene_type:complete